MQIKILILFTYDGVTFSFPLRASFPATREISVTRGRKSDGGWLGAGAGRCWRREDPPPAPQEAALLPPVSTRGEEPARPRRAALSRPAPGRGPPQSRRRGRGWRFRPDPLCAGPVASLPLPAIALRGGGGRGAEDGGSGGSGRPGRGALAAGRGFPPALLQPCFSLRRRGGGMLRRPAWQVGPCGGPGPWVTV